MTAIAGAFDPGADTFSRCLPSTHEALSPVNWPWAIKHDARACWDAWALATAEWLATQGADPRSAIVILPVGAVLAQARQAWSRVVGGWQPRIDTIASVAQAQSWAWVAPSVEATDDLPHLTLDPVLDRLQAARSLGQQAWGTQWARRDRRGFEFALDQVVDAAHIWARRLQAVVPKERPAYGDLARAALAKSAGSSDLGQGPGGRERLLLSWALEWALAAAQSGWASDALYEMRPSAWVGVSAGVCVSPGTEANLMLSVIRNAQAAGVPVRWDAAMPIHAEAGDLHHEGTGPSLVACADTEDEAQQAAAQVLTLIESSRVAGADPVALVALDRSLIRRIRALLEGAGASVADETGWHLSTTRAATVLTRLINASQPRASTDDLLDWLKSGWIAGPGGLGGPVLPGCSELESWCRRRGLVGAWGLLPHSDGASSNMPDSAAALWLWAKEALSPLQALWSQPRASLHDWMSALVDALGRSGADGPLQADPAGELAWAALHLNELAAPQELGKVALTGWPALARHTRLDGASVLRWVNAVLESVTFRPEPPDGAIDVVITPMARAVLRPFHAIVLPGADERQLGALGSPSGWIGVRASQEMDLATPASSRDAQWEAFALLMSRPNVVCLHRRGQGSEPLEPSAWLERWSASNACPVTTRQDAREVLEVQRQGVRPPRPALSEGPLSLPERVSATSYEALRQCPYRFFATALLRLKESDELEEGLDRSDFGVWLHEVLRVFHDQRGMQLALSTEAQDIASWLEAAQLVIRRTGLDRDGQRPWFLPFQAGLQRLAQGYVAWLRGHEAQGWSVSASEAEREQVIDVDEGLRVKLYGQLDRIDVRNQTEGRARYVLDYKTGSLSTLKSKVRAPLEDTQLAFYANLAEADHAAASPGRLEAAYLHLEPKGVTLVPHPDVDEAAEALLLGLSTDWQQLHRGAGMQALGEGAACTYCQARGLCRRDHWNHDEITA
jgi:ATP-dependent helicase/nuclease subunit B